ncbi:MAG: hypothetical protein E7474_02970 [Ruminococcaceae bacterium]|nr:hypothetical protein [Oscillospiraceae bacterium]
MEYTNYITKLTNEIKKQICVDDDSIRYFPSGYKPLGNEEKQFVRDTNRMYYDLDSDTSLRGDAISINLPQVSPAVCPVIRVMPSLNYDRNTDVDVVVGKIVEELKVYRNEIQNKNWADCRCAGSYERIKDQLILRPLNYYLHAKDLQNAVYEREGDIAIVLYQLVDDGTSSLLTSRITRTEIEVWGKLDDLEDVFHEAMKNTMRLFPAVVFDYSNCETVDFLKTDIASIDDILNPGGNILLSTMRVTNGALSIFYPGVREKLSKLIGETFYAVFMNVNDVMLFSKDKQSLARLYLPLTRTSDKMGEMLSDKLYVSDKRGFHTKK